MNDGSRPLRIALFTETFLPKIDGVVSILCLALRRLEELGHQVLVFGPAGGPARFAGAEIVGVGGLPLPFYPTLQVSLPGPGVWRKLRAFGPDVVHAASPYLLGALGLEAAKLMGLPILASFHTDVARYAAHYGFGFSAPLLWAYARTLHNQAHVTLCPSTAIRADLVAQGFHRVRWWRRGIDTELFSPGPPNPELRARLTDGHPDEFLVLNVGRHSPEKGLRGLREVLFAQPGVRLAMVGGGPAHAELRAAFTGTPTAFPGYLRGQELVDAYRSADAFVFPSTTETFGLVALEAMACGLPVIAARSGGVVDTVVDGVNGLFFDPAHPAEMGEAVARLLREPGLRARLAQAGVVHAQSRSWRATMDQLVGYYRAAIRVARQARR